MRRRLDAEMVRRGLAPSRAAARELVAAGAVLASGSVAAKSSRMVDPADPLELLGEPPRFVGRGGEKLSGAIEGFGIDVSGLRVLDAGASTGGFTDCLLQAGASGVLALDVGHGQLHERMRGHPDVTVMERTNLRHVSVDELGGFDAAVADLSFISLTLVTGVLLDLVRPGGWLLLLVKPQFECGRAEVSRGRGVVRDPASWRGALTSVARSVVEDGGTIAGAVVSPIRGGEGNVEFFLHVRKAAEADGSVPVCASSGARDLIDRAVRTAVERESADPSAADAAVAHHASGDGCTP